MPKTVALIPAAGSGQRLGLGPKAFLPLGDSSILKCTLEAFENKVDKCIVAVSEIMLGQIDLHILPDTQVITGGQTRQETVYKLLNECQEDIVLIHDAARPFLSSTIIKASIASARKYGAVTVVRSVTDSLIQKDSGEIVDRSALLAIQTPQSFQRELILKAHEKALREKVEATDDAALVRRLGHDVATVEGSVWLMKITTPSDYQMAQLLVQTWKQNES